MATLRDQSWGNYTGYVDLVYDEATLDVTAITYANMRARARIVDVYRMPQDTLLDGFTIPPNTPETTVPAPRNLKLVADAEGYLSLDRFRLHPHD